MRSRFSCCKFGAVGDGFADILHWLVVWATFTVVMGAPMAMAADFGAGPLPIAIEPRRAMQLERKEEIIVSGIVEIGDAGIALRVDDGASNNYASRMNAEQQLTPGPFLLTFPIESLRATDGRKLELGDIRRLILFGTGGPGRIRVDRFATQPASQGSSRSAARSLPTGRLPISIDTIGPLSEGDFLKIEGHVDGSNSVNIALRIDDGRSREYVSRYNEERVVTPGPFQLSFSARGMRTPNGRLLELHDLRRIILFATTDARSVRITRFAIEPSAALPAEVKGFSLGAPKAPLLEGFERITPDDVRVFGREATAVRRSGTDPLVSNGIKGIERLNLAYPGGTASVTLWAEDTGEWEYIPHVRRRTIKLNGKTVFTEDLTAMQWIRERYVRGFSQEHGTSDDAWSAYGRHRVRALTFTVDVDKDKIEIALNGEDANARFLNAVLVEPGGQSVGLEKVAAQRAHWYRSNWPVVPRAVSDVDLAHAVALGDPTGDPLAPIRGVAAAGTGIRLTLHARADMALSGVRATIDLPAFGNRRLTARLWAGQWRLERRAPRDMALALDDGHLVADQALPITTDLGRTYELWISVPSDAEAGVYRGNVRFEWAEGSRLLPIEITVPDVVLPKTQKSASFYLEEPYYLAWFPSLGLERNRQVACDLDLMGSFGITASAPALAHLQVPEAKRFVVDMQVASAKGAEPGWLVYSAATTAFHSLGKSRATAIMDATMQTLKQLNLPPPVWSVADEPSNPDSFGDELLNWIADLRSAIPGIRLAGHLNARQDEKIVNLFDTVLINPGFGTDPGTIDRLVSAGREVWIYNTGAPRVTAGLWLWLTGAKRYVQWHGRMPTADPADPTDGRESDAQVIYPSPTVCPAQPDIHRDLLRMAEGIVDQRWLIWLDQQAGEPAKRLKLDLQRRYGRSWDGVARLTGADLQQIRNEIIDLAVVSRR